MKKIIAFLILSFNVFGYNAIYVNYNSKTLVASRTYKEENSYRKYFITYLGRKHREEVYTNPLTKFKYIYPDKSINHTILIDANPDYGFRTYSGFNEKGLYITVINKNLIDENTLKEDPFVSYGLSKGDIVPILLMQATDIDKAIKIFDKIIKKYGVSSSFAMILAKENETKYIEITSGHNYFENNLGKNLLIKFYDDKIEINRSNIGLETLKKEILNTNDLLTAQIYEWDNNSERFHIYVNQVPEFRAFEKNIILTPAEYIENVKE